MTAAALIAAALIAIADRVLAWEERHVVGGGERE